MYSAQNKGKSVVAEGFIKTLNSKIYKKCYLVYLNKLVE